jgi:hypothetical protein
MAFAAALSLMVTPIAAEKAVWNRKKKLVTEKANNPVETTGLINFLIEHRSESDGVSFKSSMFNCSSSCNHSLLDSRATGNMCKMKWARGMLIRHRHPSHA